MSPSALMRGGGLLGLCLLLGNIPVQAKEPVLQFEAAGKLIAKRALPALRAELPAYEVTHRKKNYRAFKLADVMNMAFGNLWKGDGFFAAKFLAWDGYTVSAPLAKLREEGGYIAFEDLDTLGWEKVGHNNDAHFGPFYLVWTGRHQTSHHDYPSPYQLRTIRLIRFRDQAETRSPH